MEHRTTSPQTLRREPERRPSLIAAEHMALDALGPYDAEPIRLPPPKPVLPREEQEDGRLLRLALLPLAAWCVGVLADLSSEEMLCAVMVAGLVAGALALRR